MIHSQRCVQSKIATSENPVAISLRRIDRYSSETNTKVYGDGQG